MFYKGGVVARRCVRLTKKIRTFCFLWLLKNLSHANRNFLRGKPCLKVFEKENIVGKRFEYCDEARLSSGIGGGVRGVRGVVVVVLVMVIGVGVGVGGVGGVVGVVVGGSDR